MHNQTSGATKQYQVIDCEFNRAHYDSLINELFNNPPGYAKVTVVWVDPMEWPELK